MTDILLQHKLFSSTWMLKHAIKSKNLRINSSLQSECINFILFPYIVPSPVPSPTLKLSFRPLLPTQFHTDQLIYLLLRNNFKLKLWVWPSIYERHQTQDQSDGIELTAEGNKTFFFPCYKWKQLQHMKLTSWQQKGKFLRFCLPVLCICSISNY